MRISDWSSDVCSSDLVLVALPLMGLVVNSLGARITVGGLRWDHRAIRWWSARAARLFGIRIKVLGTPLPGGVLFVANHINWLDIVLLHSQHMMGFVAKAEIARWPLLGWLATRDRKSTRLNSSQ